MVSLALLLLSSLFVLSEQQSSPIPQHHRRGSGWPFWYDTQASRGRHSGHIYAKIGSSTSAPSRHHVGQRILGGSRTEKLVSGGAEVPGFRDYGADNDSHRHLQPGFQRRVATTPATYTRHHPGRRVCSAPAAAHHHRANQIRLVYTELANGFLCCPGWTQVTRLSYGCNNPVCPMPCQNGGYCNNSGSCSCAKGFTGSQCQTDVDECVTEKPCAQICRNLFGSYECRCRSGFELQNDGQSCRKNDTDGTAFEAQDLERDYGITTTTKRSTSRDTENEVGENGLDQDYEVILKRLNKLEKQIARGRKRDTEATESINESINDVKKSVGNVQQMQHEIYDMRSKVKQFELETRKIQHLASRIVDLENRLRLRCRSNIVMSSGLRNY